MGGYDIDTILRRGAVALNRLHAILAVAAEQPVTRGPAWAFVSRTFPRLQAYYATRHSYWALRSSWLAEIVGETIHVLPWAVEWYAMGDALCLQPVLRLCGRGGTPCIMRPVFRTAPVRTCVPPAPATQCCQMAADVDVMQPAVLRDAVMKMVAR